MRKIKQKALKSSLSVRPSSLFNNVYPLNKDRTRAPGLEIPVAKNTLTEYNPRILLIEDDPIAQFIQKRMLTELNCQVTIASNAKQALELVKNNYDIIFLDIGLPDIHGTELATAIQRMLRLGRHTRIIVVTMHREEELRRECLAIGIEKVIYKPVDIHVLKELIFTH